MTALTTALALASLLVALEAWLNHTKPPTPDPLSTALNRRPSAAAFAFSSQLRQLQQLQSATTSHAEAVKKFNQAVEAYRQHERRPMDIGTEKPAITIEPVVEPVPNPTPAPTEQPAPKETPVKTPAKEPVPA